LRLARHGALAAALLLAACATQGPELVPGVSTAAEVEARMGPPAEKMLLSNGDTEWFYPNQPFGRVTYGAVFNPAGILRSFDQRLTEANLKYLVVGKTTAPEVRALLGPPYRVLRYPRRDGDSWEWNMGPGSIDFWKQLSVRFDSAGVVADVSYIDDPARNERRRSPFGLWRF
jgi:hypothetical protein